LLLASLHLVVSLYAPAETTGGPVLPLQRLRLYETGVGYFQRKGRVERKTGLALPVPTSHLDDALKTLVVLDEGGDAKVQGIAFSTAVSEGMARAIAGLPEEADGVQYVDLLRSLEGTRVAIATDGPRIEGRLIDIEGPFGEPTAVKKADEDTTIVGQPAPQYRILVLGEDGELRRISTEDVTSIRPADKGAASRLDVAAEAISDHSARNAQRLDVQVSSGGKLGLGYIAETPVWRTSYRVVLEGEPGHARLQGWALVHNDTDEAWKGVEIELVNGRPTSFLYPLAAPRYARRELVEPPEELSTVPQLATTTPDRMWLDGEDGLGLVGYGAGGGGYGEGTIGLGNTGLIGHGGGAGIASEPSIGDLAELSQAETDPQGALFVYRVKDAVDLEAHHSALLPIVSQDIEAESITWFAPGQSDGLTGVRLVNSTSQTLPAGTVSFFAGGGFTGESVLDRLAPGERRFLAYGAELDVTVTRSREVVGETTRSLTWENDALVELIVESAKHTLDIDNRSRRDQKVYVALDVPRNAKLSAGDDVELDFDLTTQTALAATSVPAGGRAVHELSAETAGRRVHDVLDAATLEALAEREGLGAETREVVQSALELARDADRLSRTAGEASRALTDAEADLARIREDLRAMGTAGVRGRLRDKLSRELLQKEETIVELRASRRQAKTDAARARRRVTKTLESLE
jgi:hypothetical protein